MNWISDTNHSYISVRKNAFFLDWNSQPKKTKEYPHFYPRFNVEKFDLIGKATFQHRGYQLRTVPSAGGLYPCEVYVQLRGVEAFIDGIYHYEPLNSKFTLLYEITDDGIEYYIDKTKRYKGFIFLVSSVYFRSSWKYGNRAIRYILLDSGHQLAAIDAALQLLGMDREIVFDFNKIDINSIFGFDDYELSMVILKSGQEIDKPTKEIRVKFPFVAGCDYLEKSDFIIKAYNNSLNSNLKYNIKNLNFDISTDSIINRRSIRAFYKNSITDEEFFKIVDRIFDFGLEIYYTVHNIDNYLKGLYLGYDILSEGDFSLKSGYLALEQNLGKDSSVTFYFTSKYQSQDSFILAGFIAHIIYLRATNLNIGCSGIGAYYDDEVREFLNIDSYILYMLVIGR